MVENTGHSFKSLSRTACDLLVRCGMIHTFLHIFWECLVLYTFWQKVFWRSYNKLLFFRTIHRQFFSTLPLCPGKCCKKSLLLQLSLVPKACIPSSWKRTSPPTVSQWFARVINIHEIKFSRRPLRTRPQMWTRSGFTGINLNTLPDYQWIWTVTLPPNDRQSVPYSNLELRWEA